MPPAGIFNKVSNCHIATRLRNISIEYCFTCIKYSVNGNADTSTRMKRYLNIFCGGYNRVISRQHNSTVHTATRNDGSLNEV